MAKKVMLKPTEEQEIKLWKAAGTARWTYNWCLAKQIEARKENQKYIRENLLRKEITQLKKTEEFKWLNEVSSNIPKQASKDLDMAFKRYFKNSKQGVGYPKFKSRKKSKHSFYSNYENFKVKGASVHIEKVGWIKTTEQLPKSNKYLNPRVSHDGKYWYVSVGIETEFKSLDLLDTSLGVDVGLKELAICSNGMTFKNINKTRVVKRLEKRLKRLQRQVSRKYELNKQDDKFVKTENLVKLEKRIKLIYRKLTNIRNNYLHQVSTSIVKTKPRRIVMEDLNVRGMMKNKHLSKSIAQQKLYELKRQIQYKCEKYGIKFVSADRWFPSSKKCSSCGKIKKELKLFDRIYRCECGLEIDRDLNASINLANYSI